MRLRARNGWVSASRVSALALCFHLGTPAAHAEPDISAARIDSYLQGKASPLAGLGAAFRAVGIKHNIDPRLLVAIAGQETGFGRHLCASYNAWNWFWSDTCSDSPFDSWEEALETVAKYLRIS